MRVEKCYFRLLQQVDKTELLLTNNQLKNLTINFVQNGENIQLSANMYTIVCFFGIMSVFPDGATRRGWTLKTALF